MKGEDDTTIQSRSGLMRVRSSKEKKVEELVIDAKLVPHMLSFNYSALSRLTLASEPKPSPLTVEIFNLLKRKMVINRFTEGSTVPNRMKAEEKVKFLLRSFDQRVGAKPPGKSNFNIREQMMFFARRDVQMHFHQVIEDALKVKEVQNQQRKDQLTDCIRITLMVEQRDEAKARRIFCERIKRKQLPWTENMFEDMRSFADYLYHRMLGLLEQRKTLNLPPIQPLKSEDDQEEIEEVEEWAEEEEIVKKEFKIFPRSAKVNRD